MNTDLLPLRLPTSPGPANGGVRYLRLRIVGRPPVRVGRVTVSCAAFAALIALAVPASSAAELILARDGKSDYQIVVPDASPSPEVGECLIQTARLVQTAFKANGVDLPVVPEAKRDPARPCLYLGNTAFARANRVEVGQLEGWGYVHKVIGRDVIIAGHDHPAPDQGKDKSARGPSWARIGTAKGVADFLRQYVGTRFLYPDLAPWTSIAGAATVDLLASPAFEFLPTPLIAVPADLDIRKTPPIEFNTGFPGRGSFYDIANNRFPPVDAVFGGHTYGRAIPVEKYRETHPEYFALVGGKRLVTGPGQYCISNPEVQELIYQDLVGWLDRGYQTVDLGQPDGFRPCQCENCRKLFDTGDDWSEKLWIFHRKLAERVEASHPGKQVTILSYILTASPPKTFKKFPKNTGIMLTGTNEEDIAPWRECEVPRGFTSYVYNWCPNLGSRYTPMRTPLYVEAQVKRLYKYRFRAIYRDGPGDLYGLEGPVYYIMGRMLDDPENTQAKDLMYEFCEAAFGKAAPAAIRFYDELYHGIELYSQYLGTRSPAWGYRNIYGQHRNYLSDPFQLLGFLYPPRLLASLEANLAQAERTADTDKVRVRLALVRREFDYVKSLARVVHLYHAYEIQPDLASRNRLLDAIDERNAQINSYYAAKRVSKTSTDWAFVMFPPIGHDANHLRLAYDRYQEPFANTPLNWDTQAVRASPLPGARRFTVRPARGPVTIDAAQWADAEANEFVKLPAPSDETSPRSRIALPSPDEPDGRPAQATVPRKTIMKTLYDESSLYLRIESELPAALMEADAGREEELEVCLAPFPGREIAYRFTVGPQAESRRAAAKGLIADPMDPRHGKFDPDWTGDWKYETRLEPEKERWLALLTIPFKTLGVEPPSAETFWRGNAGRTHVPVEGAVQRSILFAAPQTRGVTDENSYAEIVFRVPGQDKPAQPAKHPLQKWREDYYRETFEIPAEWKQLPDPLPGPLDAWVFRLDPLERGMKEEWYRTNVNEADWLPVRVPSFWAESKDIGDYQGYAWYRTRFEVPEAWKGRPIRLLFGSVDEQAWVYVNGRLVREHTEKSEGKRFVELWETPFAVDVPPEIVEYGGKNVLAVRVHNSTANGGIWRPVLGHAMPAK